MDLKQLDYFLAVAEQRSMTHAAVRLGIAQPTLTKSIHLLDAEVGAPLFERLPRGVRLTEYGESLARHARQVRMQIADARNELGSLLKGEAGVVRIGAGPSWLRRHLPLAVARSIATRPRLCIHIAGGFDEALLRWLREGTLDFVVAEIPEDPATSDLEIEPLTADHLVVCARAEHPLRGRRKLTAHTLVKFPWALPAAPTRSRRRLDALFVAAGLPPPVPAVETDSASFLLSLLRNTDALAYTTETTLQLPEGNGIAALDVPGFRARREAGIIRRRQAWMSSAAETVIAELSAICRAEPRN